MDEAFHIYCNFLTSIIKSLQVSRKMEGDMEQYYRGIMKAYRKPGLVCEIQKKRGEISHAQTSKHTA